MSAVFRSVAILPLNSNKGSVFEGIQKEQNSARITRFTPPAKDAWYEI
jgi:hypothetical protein